VDTFTYALGNYQYFDIEALTGNVLIENGASSSAVPVPPSALLLGSGLLGLVGFGWRSKKG
jgi:hypothetical protein